jgi:hypothetical protein
MKKLRSKCLNGETAMRKRSVSENHDIVFHDTVISLFGDERDHEELKSHSVYKQFQAKFKRIHDVGKSHHCTDAETLLMVTRTFGTSMQGIAFGRLDDVADFIRTHGDTKEKILAPEMYAYLLQCGYYNQSSTAIAGKKLIGEVLNTLCQMMKNHSASDDFKKFGIEISKT